MLLVCGGDADPNLRCLLATLRRRRQPHRALLVGASHHPRLEWDVGRNALWIEGRRVNPSGLFLRYDVFTHLADLRPESAYRANAWYATLQAWQLANPQARGFNLRFAGQVFKPHVLALARGAGLATPSTRVTNDFARLARWQAREELIAKPVAGGDYCQKLRPLLKATIRRGAAAAAPAIAQTCLVPPEWRVYRIGHRFHGFIVEADALDYRTTPHCRVRHQPAVPRELTAGLRRLTDRLGLDFMAADFKACPRTGRLLFLEVNSGPMFSAFDAAGHGCLTAAMADWLADRNGGRARRERALSSA